jgi:hypothetical protein
MPRTGRCTFVTGVPTVKGSAFWLELSGDRSWLSTAGRLIAPRWLILTAACTDSTVTYR